MNIHARYTIAAKQESELWGLYYSTDARAWGYMNSTAPLDIAARGKPAYLPTADHYKQGQQAQLCFADLLQRQPCSVYWALQVQGHLRRHQMLKTVHMGVT